jgi:WD40 repeat protein
MIVTVKIARVAARMAGLCIVSGVALAAPSPTTEPILRVETGMHTTLIRRIVVDALRNRVITASDDKTIRVWQMPEVRLISVLRVPIDKGHEGQLFGLAVSPDGKTVAAGGWTGWDWDGAASIYLFDIATGELIKRISGLDQAVSVMAWSPDGRYIAVGLHGRGGFRIVQVSDAKILSTDIQYNDKVYDIDFSPQGRIATAALDGMVRLYDKDFRLIGRRIIAGGKTPISIRFSPDGELIAVGYLDAPVVSVASARDLSFLYQPAMAQIRNQASFLTVVWSSDGNYLYAGGEHKGAGLNPVYRWPEKGRGIPERIPLTRNRIAEIQQMPNGFIAYAAEDPGIGILGPDGKVAAFRGPDIVNYSDARTDVLMSADGGIVSYPLRRGGPRHSFSVLAGGDQSTTVEPTEPVVPPLRSMARIQVEHWNDSFKPTINGKAPYLETYEMARSYAIAPDGSAVLLGTEWAVRLLDRDAKEIWSQQLPAVAWSVNISQNGQIALAALSDGTIRWYRVTDGKEILAYFPHGNGQDWIAWTPDGYYTSSVYGDNYVGWHLNRGKDLAPDFYRAVQFDRILYRPDVVADTFRLALAPRTRGLDSPVSDADFQIAKLREIAPPRLRLSATVLQGLASGRPRATLRLEGEKNVLDIKDYTVFVNSVPVTPNEERKLSGRDNERFSRTLEIDLPARANDIRVEAFNGVSMGTAETYIGLPADVRSERVAGNLYILAIGANVFPNLPANMHLAFAASDAEAMAATFEKRGAGHYNRIFTRVLSDDSPVKPDRDAIISALDFVQQGKPQDTVVIFLASHGLSDKAGNYYFVPRDVARKDVAAVQKGETGDSLVPWTAFFDALRGATGKRILIVDTCHAQRIEGRFESHSLMKRSASSLFPLIVASKGEEQSQEYPPAKHGLFTYALMSALTPEADVNRDGVVSLKEAFDFAIPLVEKLREKTIGSQTPQMVAPYSLGEFVLIGAGS